MSQDKNALAAKVGIPVAVVLLALIPVFEGTVLKTYRDPVGILTACVGHTGAELRPGQTFTRDQCADMLARDLLKHADDLDCVTVPLGTNTKVALISFTFNVGKKNFCGSTLVRRLNAGEWPYACAELSKWVYAKGQLLPGLVSRRKLERDYCEAG